MDFAFMANETGAEHMSTEPRNFGPGQVGRHWQRLLLGVALVAPIALATATAAPPMTGIPDNARLISDDELGDMRGRYIEAEQVNFFGIQMVSMWQTGDGSVLTASLEFEVDVNNGQFADNAALHANWSGTCVGRLAILTLDIPNTTPARLDPRQRRRPVDRDQRRRQRRRQHPECPHRRLRRRFRRIRRREFRCGAQHGGDCHDGGEDGRARPTVSS